MCGIVGYVGPDASGRPLDVVMEGLARLEYRGYDSAGVALVTGESVFTEKRAGKLANLRAALEAEPVPVSATAIGHTRWATHGGPTDENAHPHRGGADGKLAVVHNGIVENFHALKSELLEQGVDFTSETDTEVAAQLLAEAFVQTGELTEAMRLVVGRLEGAFTLLAVHADQPDVVVAARRNSPLVVGLGEGENFLGSDVAAFIGFTKQAV
ncbi:MAG: glutamine--fructose-6-phosphate transaminase (isomerizing), partial [Janibacter sp.]